MAQSRAAKLSFGLSTGGISGGSLTSHCVSSHPTHRVELNAAEFGETFTFTSYKYMGCESRPIGAPCMLQPTNDGDIEKMGILNGKFPSVGLSL